jgi:hypothetical protein
MTLTPVVGNYHTLQKPKKFFLSFVLIEMFKKKNSWLAVGISSGSPGMLDMLVSAND